MSVDEIWKSAMEQLKEMVTLPAYELLIKRIVPVSLDEESFIIKIPGTLSMEYLKDYKETIQEVVQSITGMKVELSAMQDDEAHEPTIPEPLPSRPEPAAQEAPVVNTLKRGAPFLNPKYTFENFVVGSNNLLAYNASRTVAEAPGKAYNPLFIYGGVGLGKTHLMQAIGHYLAATKPNLVIEYITSDMFLHEFMRCIRENRLHDFRTHYSRLDVLFIDDVQFLEGKDRTQYEFFQIFNDFYEKKRQMVITCDRLPKDIPTIEDRLISRLNWGLVCDIQSPDFETRLSILNKRLENNNSFVNEEVLQYIAETIKEDIRSLEGALNKIIAYSKLMNVDVTMELAEKIINDIANPPRDSITVKDIIDTVAKHYSVDPGDIRGKSRKKEVTLPRSVAMYFSRYITQPQPSLSAIGKEFGNRDHTTVIYSCEKIEKEIKRDASFKKLIKNLEEKIKG